MRLTSHFCGPYKVLKHISPVTYCIDLSQEIEIHPVYHVPYLKMKLGTHVFFQQHLSDIASTGKICTLPAAISDRRLVKCPNQTAVNILIQWTHLPREDATWEPYNTIKEHFADFIGIQPWGQGCF